MSVISNKQNYSPFEKGVNFFTPFCLSVKYLFLTCVVFLSWNFTGLLFVLYLYSLFYTIDKYRNLNFRIFCISVFLHLLAFHIGVLFWMFNIKYGITGFLVSLIYYFLPFLAYYFFNKYIVKSLFIFIPIFSLYELFLDTVDFSFTWIIIGNCLSNSKLAPQIYQYIGTIGGSLALLKISYFLYCIKNNSIKLLLILTISCFLYLFGYLSVKLNISKNDEIQYLNCLFFDPKNYALKNKYIDNQDLSFYLKKEIKNIDYDKVFIPESTFKSISFKNFENSLLLDYLKEICSKNNSEIYFGASGVIKSGILSNVFVYFNGNDIKIKAKEKLVPYSEYTPLFFRRVLNRNISFDYLYDDNWKTFKNEKKELPLVCYEIVYSNYVSKNIQNTDLIILLSSEEFFNDSYFGKKQYNNIIRLRAIETRKPIIKSSNGGENLFIDRNGIIQNSCQNEFCTFMIDKSHIKPYPDTFYSKFIVKNSIYLYLNFLLIFIVLLKK